MCKDAEDVPWHATRGQYVEKLHCLHLEAVVAVDHEQDDIGDFGYVDHAGEGVCRALNERQSPSF